MQPRHLTMTQYHELKCYDEAAVPGFFFRLKNNPRELLVSMLEKAITIMKTYENTHPVQDKVTRRCLIQLQITIELIAPKETERKRETSQQENACISLYSCFKTMLNICGNNNENLRESINSFFDHISARNDYFAEKVINSFHLPLNESDLNNQEKVNYEQAFTNFERALTTYKTYNLADTKEHKDLSLEISKLKDLKDNGIDLHFCSLVLNTAAQRLEDPTNKFHQKRLVELSVAIEDEEPSTIMKYLPTILKIVGAVVALVGLALLLTPPSLIATLGVAAQTPTASTALSIAAGGVATLFMGTRLPSPSRYEEAANTINNANNTIIRIAGHE